MRHPGIQILGCLSYTIAKGTMDTKEKDPTNAEQKKRDLYLRQKELLATLLENGAISPAQHDKSLGDLTEKMGMQQNV